MGVTILFCDECNLPMMEQDVIDGLCPDCYEEEVDREEEDCIIPLAY